MNQNSMSHVVFKIVLSMLYAQLWLNSKLLALIWCTCTYIYAYMAEGEFDIPLQGATHCTFMTSELYTYIGLTPTLDSYLFLLLFSVQTKHWRLPCIFLPFVLIVVDYMYSTGCCIGRINLLRVKLYFLTE